MNINTTSISSSNPPPARVNSTASVCGANTSTLLSRMTPGTLSPTMRPTPDWIRQANELVEDDISEASLDPDDMSISDNSYDGDVSEMFPGDYGTPYNNTTFTCTSSTVESDRTTIASALDQHDDYPPDCLRTPSPAISQETLDTDRTDTIHDVNEAADKIPPLLMRYCPDGTHCIATWNVNNCFHAETIVKIMLRCNISILVLQEPKHAPTTVNNEKYINKTLQKYGLKGFFSDFQYLIFNEAALGARVKEFKSTIGGRIITFQLQIGDANSKDFINIIGCYGAAHGDHKYKPDSKEYKYGHTRNIHRTHVYHTLRKILGKEPQHIRTTSNGILGPKKHIIGNILLGDIQETISTTNRDNLGGIHYNPPKHGILNALRTLNRKMISAVREHEGHTSYITRESLSTSRSGRGISHILVDSRIDDMYVGGCVDKIVASGALSTDHHIIAADFAFNMEDIQLQNGLPIEPFKWGRIANILMELIPPSEPSNTPTLKPKQDTPHTAEWEQNMQLFADLQHIFENDPDICTAAESFHCQMLTIQQNLITASAHLTQEDQDNGILIESLPGGCMGYLYVLAKKGSYQIRPSLRRRSHCTPEIEHCYYLSKPTRSRW